MRWLGWWCARLPLSELCQGFPGIQIRWLLLRISVLFHENATVDHAPDWTPESVHHSSPLASQGFVAPPGLHRLQFQGKGWGWGWWPAKKQKKCHARSGNTSCVTTFWGWGGGVVMFSAFQYGPKQEIETLVHEHEW